MIVLSACKGPEGSGGETVVTRQLDEPVREYKRVDRRKEWNESAVDSYADAHQEHYYDIQEHPGSSWG